MPRRRPPPPLRRICLGALADHLTRLANQQGPDVTQHPHVREFFRLPVLIAGELLAILKDSNSLRAELLALLVQPGITHLGLAWFNVDLNVFLTTNGPDLQHLLHLDLSFSLAISLDAFLTLPTCIPRIQVLHLQSTGCPDTALSLLGTFCPDLRDLDLAWCPVSDRGLMGLCVDLTAPASGPASFPRCQRLRRLGLSGTLTTVAGVAFVLERLPRLQELDFADTFEVLEALHGHDLETRSLDLHAPHYQLTSLRSSGGGGGRPPRLLTPEAFKIATATCPRLRRVELCNADAAVEGLLLLSRCRRLAHLELAFGSHNVLAFADVLPLLEVSGTQLTRLGLGDLSGVDVAVLGRCCPSLTHLSLCDIEGYVPLPTTQSPTSAFKRLRSFSLLDAADDPIPASSLLAILGACKGLEEILLSWCLPFSDRFVSRLLATNGLPNLRAATFASCDLLTRTGLLPLLSSDNPLRRLSLQHCRALPRPDYRLLVHYAKHHNLDLVIEWVE